ncbi:hypothetical protein Chor_000269, partial [Crotalus horridus]
ECALTLPLPNFTLAKIAEMPILPFLLSFGVLACCAAKVVAAAFAGLMYLFVRQKYFVGYMGERTQSTPGYIFGKRIIFFLFLMSVAGVLNYYLGVFFGSDFQIYIKTITNTISPLLLIP